MCWQRSAPLRRTAGPLPAASYRALAEPALREVVREMLAAAGRVLVETGTGYTSGYDDGIADRLAEEGIGVLPPEDRAVLTLVLLFSVAIPRAEGKLAPEAPWTRGRPVRTGAAVRNEGSQRRRRGPLQRLQDAGITRNVGDSVRPGPQFDRLTPATTITIFEELLLLADPQGPLADAIRRRRASSAPPPLNLPFPRRSPWILVPGPISASSPTAILSRSRLLTSPGSPRIPWKSCRVPSSPSPVSGPDGDSNGSGKTSFQAAVSVLLGDPQWRLETNGGSFARELLFRPDAAGLSAAEKATSAPHGYIVGVFADPESPLESALTVWVKISSTAPYLQARCTPGLHVADADDDEERALQADALWQQLPKDQTISARNLARNSTERHPGASPTWTPACVRAPRRCSARR